MIDPTFAWWDDRPPRTPWERTVIYEAHVRGLTMLNEALPEEVRGTYAGLAHPQMIAYLRDLGRDGGGVAAGPPDSSTTGRCSSAG